MGTGDGEKGVEQPHAQGKGDQIDQIVARRSPGGAEDELSVHPSSPSQHGEDLEDFIKKHLPAGLPPAQLREDGPVPEEEDPLGIAGGEGVVGHQEDGGPQVAVHVLQGGQEHLGGVAVQGPGGFVGQDQLGPVHHGPGAGAALLLSPGDLVGVLVQNVSDV